MGKRNIAKTIARLSFGLALMSRTPENLAHE